MARVTLWTAAAGAVGLGADLDDARVLSRLHAAIKGAEATGDAAWIDVAGVARLGALRSLLGVHPLTLEDMAATDGREKCEAYSNYVFMALRDGSDWVHVAVTQHVILTVRTNESERLSIHSVLASRTMQAAASGEPPTPDWLAYLVLDELVDGLSAAGAALQAEVDAVDELALSLGISEQTDMVRRIWAAMRRATDLQRTIVPRIEVVRALAAHGARADQSECGALSSSKSGGARPLVHTRTLFYLRDVQDHLDGLRTSLAEHAEALGRAHDNFVAQADVELALAGQRMGASAKHLALVTFAMGMTAGVTAVMGMNVKVPFEHGESPLTDLGPFFGMVSAIAAISVALYLYGVRARWL